MEENKHAKAEKQKLLEENLRNFSNGTDTYYKMYPNIVITDGVKYLSDKAESYWLLDIIFSVQTIEKVRIEPFQVCELQVYENESALVTITDGNENTLYTQKIPYTDFPLKNIKMYYTDGVILLPSEY